MAKPWSEVDLIREAFHYQTRFDGSTMVFKVDFPVAEGPLFPSLAKDLALLSRSGFHVVIVPGAKERIDAVLSEYRIVSSYTNVKVPYDDRALTLSTPIRITTNAAMPFVEMAAFDVATRFMTGLAGSRVDAIIGNFVRGRGLGVLNGAPMERTGTVDKFYTESLNRVLNLGMVPILPCIGWSPSGKPYNVPSDEIALQAALNLKAIKLFIVTLSGGLTNKSCALPEGIAADSEGRPPRLSPQEAAKILRLNAPAFPSKPLSELSLAYQALEGGVERVHIVDGGEEGAVLREIFSNTGSGTMLNADEYESIRPIRSKDVPDLLRLMEPLMREGVLLRRTAEEIQQHKDEFAVFVIDNRIHACAALREWGEGQAEIAALATDPAYVDKGLGSALVRCLTEKARKRGLTRVFVLTTRTQDWFEALGFREAPLSSLPSRKRAAYDSSRNSLIFALDL